MCGWLGRDVVLVATSASFFELPVRLLISSLYHTSNAPKDLHSKVHIGLDSVLREDFKQSVSFPLPIATLAGSDVSLRPKSEYCTVGEWDGGPVQRAAIAI
jgi:hypothetical protein